MNPLRKALVVGDDLDVWTPLSNALAAVGFDVVRASCYHEARELLVAARPEILITAVRLGAFNGLQLVLMHSHVDQGASVAVDVEHDPITETEARRLGAAYTALPLSIDRLLEAINNAAARRGETGDRRRRWTRTRLPAGVPVAIETARGVLTEVGYGGFRIELADVDAHIPLRFTLRAHGLSFPVRAMRVWERRYDASLPLHCGASIEDQDSESVVRWRKCVDHWQALGA